MTTPTICAALDVFQQAANRGTAVYLSLELVQELRDALKTEPEAEGPSVEQMYYWALKSIRQYGSDTLSGRADGGADDREWQRAAVAEMVRRAQEALDYGIPATPPAPELGEVPSDELMEQWKEECKRLSLESDYAIPPSSFMAQRVVAWARQQQAAKLAALRGVPVAGISDEHRDAVHEAVAEAPGNAYDCQRVWSAWSYGTMGPDDFTLTAEDDDRVAEITDAAIEVIGNFAMQTEVTVSEQLQIVKAGIRAGYNLGHHHTVESCWGDPDEVADDIAQDTLDDLSPLPVPQGGEGEA